MSIDPHHAFDEFLRLVKDSDPATPFDEEKIVELAAPFLLNPERHREHVSVMLEAAAMTGALNALKPLLQLSDAWPFTWAARMMPSEDRPRAILARERDKLLAKVQRLGSALRDSVQVGELRVDVLPVRALDTDASWKALGKQLVLFEVRTSIRPRDGFHVSRSAFELQFVADPPVHIVSAKPETEFEILGDREVTRSLGGKVSETSQATDEAALGAKALAYEASVKFIDSTTRSAEYAHTLSATIKDRPMVPRVSCDAVGSIAHWDLYATPSHIPSGGSTFELRVLVDRRLASVDVKSSLVATFASWGPVESRGSVRLDLVFKE